VIVGEHIRATPSNGIDDIGGNGGRGNRPPRVHARLDEPGHDDAHAHGRAERFKISAEYVREA
jgi:hypothetical protein